MVVLRSKLYNSNIDIVTTVSQFMANKLLNMVASPRKTGAGPVKFYHLILPAVVTRSIRPFAFHGLPSSKILL